MSPPAARQTQPPADRASFLSPHFWALFASLSPVPPDAAPHATTPADRETEDASGHAKHHGRREWQQDMRNETPGNEKGG